MKPSERFAEALQHGFPAEYLATRATWSLHYVWWAAVLAPEDESDRGRRVGGLRRSS